MRRRRKCGRLAGKEEELERKGGREKGKEGSRDREKKEGRKKTTYQRKTYSLGEDRWIGGRKRVKKRRKKKKKRRNEGKKKGRDASRLALQVAIKGAHSQTTASPHKRSSALCSPAPPAPRAEQRAPAAPSRGRRRQRHLDPRPAAATRPLLREAAGSLSPSSL